MTWDRVCLPPSSASASFPCIHVRVVMLFCFTYLNEQKATKEIHHNNNHWYSSPVPDYLLHRDHHESWKADSAKSVCCAGCDRSEPFRDAAGSEDGGMSAVVFGRYQWWLWDVILMHWCAGHEHLSLIERRPIHVFEKVSLVAFPLSKNTEESFYFQSSFVVNFRSHLIDWKHGEPKSCDSLLPSPTRLLLHSRTLYDPRYCVRMSKCG